MCRTRVAVLGRDRRERVMIPRVPFCKRSPCICSKQRGEQGRVVFETTGAASHPAALGQALPRGRGRVVVPTVRHSPQLPPERILTQRSTSAHVGNLGVEAGVGGLC